ncbi:MAG: phage shock protein, partial [Chloroflexota bacterium]|nr:phage shock protein [Chloroflexota bacterium]
QQTELVANLKDGLNKLRSKREELVQKRDELVSRAKMAQAQIQVQDAVRSVSVMDPTSELNRFEDRIRRQEGLARGREEVAASSLDAQFEQLESGADDLEVEERLRQLKSGASGGQLTAGGGSAG